MELYCYFLLFPFHFLLLILSPRSFLHQFPCHRLSREQSQLLDPSHIHHCRFWHSISSPSYRDSRVCHISWTCSRYSRYSHLLQDRHITCRGVTVSSSPYLVWDQRSEILYQHDWYGVSLDQLGIRWHRTLWIPWDSCLTSDYHGSSCHRYLWYSSRFSSCNRETWVYGSQNPQKDTSEDSQYGHSCTVLVHNSIPWLRLVWAAWISRVHEWEYCRYGGTWIFSYVYRASIVKKL